jgi:hypothetical protein
LDAANEVRTRHQRRVDARATRIKRNAALVQFLRERLGGR